MSGSIYRWSVALALVLGCFSGIGATTAVAVPAQYTFDPSLSLSGKCTTTTLDPFPDPSCPYPPPPDGPSGPFDKPSSIAVDAYGYEYVASFGGPELAEQEEGRIDVFDDEGKFVTELSDVFGPSAVAVDTEGNLYVYENALSRAVVYEPSTYEPESGEVEYLSPAEVVVEGTRAGIGLAVDFSDDHLFAASSNKILEFGPASGGNEPLHTFDDPKIGDWNQRVGVDAQRRRLYASYCKDEFEECGVLVFNADEPYELLEEIDGSSTPTGKFLSAQGYLTVAVDEETGHFFVEDLIGVGRIYEFDVDYDYVSDLTFGELQVGRPQQIAVSNSPLNGDAVNYRHLFVPVWEKGRALAFASPGVEKPEVELLAVTNIGQSEAEFQARINPNGGATHYVFEYTTQESFELEEFDGAQIAGEGDIGLEKSTTLVKAFPTHLEAGTTYRFRVRAENEMGEDEQSLEATFATYSDAPMAAACPNEPVRSGFSAALPDCRAFELVTPPDTNGHPPKGPNVNGDRFATLLASPAGNVASFMFEGGALPGEEGTGGISGDPYRATRGAMGWNTLAVGPTGGEATVIHPGSNSPDQGFAFWEANEEGSAVVEWPESDYVRYPDGHSEFIGRGSLGTDPRAGGRLITENGTHIVFQTEGPKGRQLEPEAPPGGINAVYDRTPDEVTHVVSLLPGDETPDEDAYYVGSSAEGNGIAFEIGNPLFGFTLFLRVNNEVTYEIGSGVEFAGVSDGGERIFYAEDENLFAYDTVEDETIAFSAVGDATVINVAPDGTRAYFVSPSVIPEAGENPNGVLAKPGKLNLYLSEEGKIRFVGTLTDRDVVGEHTEGAGQIDGLGLWTYALSLRQPAKDPSRVTPDGSVLLFQSRAKLDGYDSEGAPQIYRYDSVDNRLHCLSCIPTKAPANGGASLETFYTQFQTPPPFSPFGYVQNLRADGRRAFFESTEALVSRDADDVNDVYEWEEQGVGSCTRPGGCVYLITSGHSARDNYLYGHSASGDDVFFTTGDVLNGFDAGGTNSIYDARVGGGFPIPLHETCLGEGCRPGLSSGPPLTVPASKLQPQGIAKRCARGRRKVKRAHKVRCVKKKHHRHQHRKARGGSKGAQR